MGGNSRNNARGIVIDWNLALKTFNKTSHKLGSQPKKSKEILIHHINKILNLVEYVHNPETLCELLHEMFELQPSDYVKFLEHTLNLNEAIIIQLRKLFYVFVELDKDDKYRVEFCPFTPIARIEKLLDLMHADKENEALSYEIKDSKFKELEDIIDEIKEYVYKRDIIRDNANSNDTLKNILKDGIKVESMDYNEHNNDKVLFNKLIQYMDKFIKSCEILYKSLDDIEKINIEIASKIERLASIASQSYTHFEEIKEIKETKIVI
jgi:hypothetical protein